MGIKTARSGRSVSKAGPVDSLPLGLPARSEQCAALRLRICATRSVAHLMGAVRPTAPYGTSPRGEALQVGSTRERVSKTVLYR